MDNLISRQAAIDLLKQMRKDGDMVPWEGKDVFARIRKLPSAQPVTHEERMETHACDLISRQDAIDAINAYLGLSAVSRTIQNMTSIQEILENLPSAEPRKKGKWIKFNNSCTIRCNQCGKEMTSLCDIQLPNYCPNCGSYNGGEEE